MLDTLLTKIKSIAIWFSAVVVGAFALLFLYQRNQINEALLKEQVLNKSLDKHDSNIEKNNEELAREEAYRKALALTTKDADVIDIMKRLGKND